jgi:hypothetical protein
MRRVDMTGTQFQYLGETWEVLSHHGGEWWKCYKLSSSKEVVFRVRKRHILNPPAPNTDEERGVAFRVF